MTALTVRIKRHADGSASLTCTRADGTMTWQRQRGGYALVFPTHDLTHYAVETTLRYEHGFFGLIADGWDISDFDMPWPRGLIPQEALEVELIAGVFESERRHIVRRSLEEFRAHAEQYVAGRRIQRPSTHTPDPPVLSEIERVHTTLDELLRRWGEVPVGGALELRFVRAGDDSLEG